MRIEKIMAFASVGLLLTGCGEAPSGKYSRGVGIYPGTPMKHSRLNWWKTMKHTEMWLLSRQPGIRQAMTIILRHNW